MSVTERTARMGLCSLQPLGSPPLVKAVEEFGAVDVWRGLLAQPDGGALSRKAALVDTGFVEVRRATIRCGARFLIPSDHEWPPALSDLTGRNVAGPDRAAAGALGARAPRCRARRVAWLWSGPGPAPRTGSRRHHTRGGPGGGRVPVVSGLAFGVDAAAHRGALGGQGLTPLWSPADWMTRTPPPTPASRRPWSGVGALALRAPAGARPTRYAFLARNRHHRSPVGSRGGRRGLLALRGEEHGLLGPGAGASRDGSAWAHHLVACQPHPIASSATPRRCW